MQNITNGKAFSIPWIIHEYTEQGTNGDFLLVSITFSTETKTAPTFALEKRFGAEANAFHFDIACGRCCTVLVINIATAFPVTFQIKATSSHCIVYHVKIQNSNGNVAIFMTGTVLLQPHPSAMSTNHGDSTKKVFTCVITCLYSNVV